MYALQQDLVATSGVEHATFVDLTSSSIRKAQPSSVRVIANLIVARSNLLRVFEVREEPAPLPTLEEEEGRTRNAPSKLDTDAVEGEVEMDEEGEGFVNMARVKVWQRFQTAVANVLISLPYRRYPKALLLHPSQLRVSSYCESIDFMELSLAFNASKP